MGATHPSQFLAQGKGRRSAGLFTQQASDGKTLGSVQFTANFSFRENIVQAVSRYRASFHFLHTGYNESILITLKPNVNIVMIIKGLSTFL